MRGKPAWHFRFWIFWEAENVHDKIRIIKELYQKNGNKDNRFSPYSPSEELETLNSTRKSLHLKNLAQNEMVR